MRTTFSSAMLLVILFSQNTYAQSVSGSVSTDPATVDFATTAIAPGSVLPGYSGSVTIDDKHKLQISCQRFQDGQTFLVPCIKNADGALVLGNASLLPYVSNSGAVYFDPPAVSVSGLITGEIGSSSLSPKNILQVAIDNITLLLKNNPPRVFSYPFSYSAPGGINLLQLSGFFTQTVLGFPNDPNAFYKVGLKTLTWSTKQANLTLKKVDISPAQRTANEKFAVKPDEEINFNLTITTTDLRPVDDRVAIVELRFLNTDEILTQAVPVSALSVSGGHIVNFKKKFTADDVGEISYTASVRIGEDQDFSDNDISDSFYVYCNVEKTIKYFSQAELPWGPLPYAFSEKNKIRGSGCYTTSFAMLMHHYGIKKSYNGNEINPESVNSGFINFISDTRNLQFKTKNAGYDNNSNVIGPGAADFARVSYIAECVKSGKLETECKNIASSKISFISKIDFNSNNFLNGFKTINNNICKNNPVIIKVPSARYPDDLSRLHFVLAKGMSVDVDGKIYYEINDPCNISTKRIALEKVRGYRLFNQIADPSMFYIAVTGNLNMLITEPSGKLVGVNSLQNIMFDESESSSYSTPEAITTYDEITDNELSANYINVNAEDGLYSVEVFNHKSTAVSFSIMRNSYDVNGMTSEMNEQQGLINPGQSVIYRIQHNSAIYSENNVGIKVYQAKYFDKLRIDKAFISGRILSDKIAIANEVKVSINSEDTIIPIKKFAQNLSRSNQLIYTYAKWSNKEVFFKLNTKTGEFLLYFDNINLDESKPNLTVDLRIALDSLVAKSPVTFKNIARRKYGK